MIDRILFHIHSNDLFNDNQYGFILQKRTVVAAMEVKTFIEESLRLKQCAVIVNLDVKGAFDAAWWPRFLKQVRVLKYPKNLYNLSASYFIIGKHNYQQIIIGRKKKFRKDFHRSLVVAQAFGMLCIIHF